ncbi:hypothetical protein NUBL1866_51870 [Klebsiella pneumoniae]|nr:hypothetical protein NUBL1866_51870 [Klebsiella pneumoniae]
MNITRADRAYTDFQPQISLNILDRKREKSIPVKTPAIILPIYRVPPCSLLKPAVIRGIADVPVPIRTADADNK